MRTDETKTYITLKDAKTKRSICATVYGARPKQVLERIQSLIASGGKSDKEKLNTTSNEYAPAASPAITRT